MSEVVKGRNLAINLPIEVHEGPMINTRLKGNISPHILRRRGNMIWNVQWFVYICYSTVLSHVTICSVISSVQFCEVRMAAPLSVWITDDQSSEIRFLGFETNRHWRRNMLPTFITREKKAKLQGQPSRWPIWKI